MRSVAACTVERTLHTIGNVRISVVPIAMVGVVAAMLTPVGCSKQPTAPQATVGALSGTVASSLVGGVPGASVVAMPASGSAPAPATTTMSGSYVLSNVPKGTGTVAVTNLPGNCTQPASQSYAVSPPDTAHVNFMVSCINTGG